MITKLNDLNEAWPAILVLANDRTLPAPKKQTLYRLLRVAGPEVANFQNRRDRDLILKHGEPLDADRWHMPKVEQKAAYLAELEQLKQSTVELPELQFTEEEVVNTLSAAEMITVERWIVQEETCSEKA